MFRAAIKCRFDTKKRHCGATPSVAKRVGFVLPGSTRGVQDRMHFAVFDLLPGHVAAVIDEVFDLRVCGGEQANQNWMSWLATVAHQLSTAASLACFLAEAG